MYSTGERSGQNLHHIQRVDFTPQQLLNASAQT